MKLLHFDAAYSLIIQPFFLTVSSVPRYINHHLHPSLQFDPITSVHYLTFDYELIYFSLFFSKIAIITYSIILIFSWLGYRISQFSICICCLLLTVCYIITFFSIFLMFSCSCLRSSFHF